MRPAIKDGSGSVAIADVLAAQIAEKVALERYDFKASLDLECDFEVDPGVGRI